jgi:hypothetical protein
MMKPEALRGHEFNQLFRRYAATKSRFECGKQLGEGHPDLRLSIGPLSIQRIDEIIDGEVGIHVT